VAAARSPAATRPCPSWTSPAPSGGGGSGEDTSLPGPTTTNSQGCCDGGAGAEAVAQEFLAAVRAGDEAAATATLCEDSDEAADVTDAIARGASLDVDPSTVENGGGNEFRASLLGVIDGEPITTGYVSAWPDLDGERWCVDSFYAG